jgi:hypothetical protein
MAIFLTDKNLTATVNAGANALFRTETPVSRLIQLKGL